MGGVVSTGRDNDDLVDNLKEAEYIKSEKVEDVFRIVDRAHYYLPECRESAYKDLAWKNGTLHLSAPCIYSEVMEALELRSGLSFLNIGSGTGYLNTMVGYMIGPFGINHGIELHASNVTYAEERLKKFKEICQRFDDLELCEPVFVQGNCLSLAPDNRRYDRVYCGAACPAELISTVQNMIKIQGILVVPVGDQLLKIKRLSEADYVSENVLPVSFASLVEPSTPKDVQELIMLPVVNPMSLQDVCRITVREAIRHTFTFVKHTPKHSAESSRQSKILQSTVCRHERGRYPLNILPTTQGLMIMGAFTDDSDDSDDSEIIDGSFLDQQLQQHARQRRRDLDTAEVDSNLSDDEHNSEDGNAEDTTTKSANYFRSARAKLKSIESEDGIVADDEEDEDETEMKETSLGMKEEDLPEEVVLDDSHPRGFLPDARTKTFRINCTENGTTKRLRVAALERRTWVETREIPKPPTVNLPSLSSDDEIVVPKSSVNSSPAIEMNVLASNARTTKTSYSTSAETSETSGFGSLGDDQVHIGSVHSGLSNLEDDTVVTAEDKSDQSSSGARMLSNSSTEGKVNAKTKKPVWLEFSHHSDSSGDDDAETANDEGDEGDVEDAWMDIDDEDDGQDIGIRPIGETILESPETNKLIQDMIEGPSHPPSGFTVFLKKQVEELPIPGPMKTYICHFR